MRLIFRPNLLSESLETCVPLAYVQLFKQNPSSLGTIDSCTNLHSFVRDLNIDDTWKGLVIPLTDIWLTVQAIPVFGKKCNPHWTCDSAVELASELRVNVFDCLATYLLVY